MKTFKRHKNIFKYFLVFVAVILSGVAAHAQQITVSAKVVNKDNEPLKSVTVLVQGTLTHSITDSAGNFTIRQISPAARLLLTSLGYKPLIVTAASIKKGVPIVLQDTVIMLDDVVITGFQKIDRNKFTGAVNKLKTEDIKIEGITDVGKMLEGRAAGVSVQNVSGTFGAAPKIRIRGATSITGVNKPLWVVDGVVLEDIVNLSNEQLTSGDASTLLGSSVAGLNINDIESIDILKDAAATALYGARAMNGVIVVTTKKGKQGKTTINGNITYALNPQPNYNQYDILNSADQLAVYAALERNGYLPFSDLTNRSDYGIYGILFSKITKPNANGVFEVENTPEAKSAWLSQFQKVNTDWFDVLFRNSVTQEYSVSVSSGTEKAQSYFSTSFYNDNGWTIADKVQRYTANLKNSYQLTPSFNFSFLVNASYRHQQTPGANTRNSNPVESKFDRDFDINPFSYVLNTSRLLTPFNNDGSYLYYKRNFADFNILEELENNRIKLNLADLKLQLQAGYTILPNLQFDFNGALRLVKTSKEAEITERSNQANAYRAAATSLIRERNKFLYLNPDNPTLEREVVLPYGGFYNREETQLLNYTFRNTLSWNKKWDNDYAVNIIAGQEVKYLDRQSSSNTGFGYQYNSGGTPFVDYRIIKQLLENNFQYYSNEYDYERFMGLFANVSWQMKDKIILASSFRRDGSNRLGASSTARWLPTWTVSGRWNMEKEDFLNSFSALSFLTLRGSYGLKGDYGVATNSKMVLKNEITNRAYSSDKERAIAIENIENADLGWEKQLELDAGIDAGFFKNRLTISLDAYWRNSFDLISIVRTAGIGGQAYKAANYADMKGHGIDLVIGVTPVAAPFFRWNSSFTLGYGKNKITNVKNLPQVWDLVAPSGGNKEGYPVRSLFSIQFAGLNPENGIAWYYGENNQLITSDTNNIFLQSTVTDFLKYEGPVDPVVQGGWNHTFTYKNFSLNLLFTYQAGNYIRLYQAWRAAYSDLDAMPGAIKNRWQQPGDELYTNIPSIADLYGEARIGAAASYPYNYYNYSDKWVVKGDFLRLKTMGVSYRLNTELVRRLGLNMVQASLSANNLWLIIADRRLRGQDPEFFNSGGVAMPVSRQFIFSVKLGW